MATYVLRVWLPDRPGALGAVASRVGAIGGDVVGIDILETGAGRAIDELVIRLPEAGEEYIPLLINEVHQVDGVNVETIRRAADAVSDPRLDALETAAVLVGASTATEAIAALCEHAVRTLSGGWGAVLELETGDVVAAEGDAPEPTWLRAFVAGSQSSARESAGRGGNGGHSHAGPDDVVWAPLPTAGMALVIGRHEQPFRARERRQAAALARIVDTRFRELRAFESRLVHPSAG